ncbi:hypothetical protein NLU13_2544 [Sarocladium strictum]|uniref:GPI inositol-deacylase n=1 Tax=Sarocladium strictum TaxID=5046 RepID=A0AA39L9F0_SARSR|nr:hypothetical protein NLU13_2544 [Sarocladium strictum]
MKLFINRSLSASRDSVVQTSTLRSGSNAPTLNAIPQDVEVPKGRLGLTTLSHPHDPIIEIVFVHGLGGDSRKTWGATDHGHRCCWPADWLPNKPGFERVRVHTFGYDTKFLRGTGNCLNIHHIGKLLLGELTVSPLIRQCDSRIVFVAHSMGGLVVKKTILLAKQDPSAQRLADRFASIFFLACPHRGADSAKLLRRVLRVAYDRQYVADLERNSTTTQSINEEFRHCSKDFTIWSFYETKKMKYWSSLVVDESSALLGYPHEKQMAMNADHRTICKFDSPSDANYLTLLNSLSVTVNELQTELSSTRRSTLDDEFRSIRELLGFHAPADDTLELLREKREPGTCEWLLSQPCFDAWAKDTSYRDPVLWISGKPGWGKSVLSAFVVDYLREIGRAVSCFFFSFSNARKSTIGDAVRSLTYQLAMSDESCRTALLTMYNDGIRLDGMEERSLWRTLARGDAFRNMQRPQYCVLDGLDECREPQGLVEALVQDLEDAASPFRLLMVGRDLPSISAGFGHLRSMTFHHMSMIPSNTLEAVSKLVRHRISALSFIKPKDREGIASRIIEKSQGSFLWVDLVIQQLAQCHGWSQVSERLEKMPSGMGPVYTRILEIIARDTAGRDLAHRILSWVVCATRPLALHELEEALACQRGTTFTDFGHVVTSLCGQLVMVDQIGRITLQHETVKDFLLNQESHPHLAIEEGESHAKIAQACLKLFNMKDFRQKFSSGKICDGFSMYALAELPSHLSRATGDLRELLEATVRFFKMHVLLWIAFIVKFRDLNSLGEASSCLKSFYQRCLESNSSSQLSLRYLSQVAIDLSRVSYKFGNVLKADPQAIHTIVPEFCPAESSIYRGRKQNQSLQVVGGPSKRWDDTLLSISMDKRIRSVASRGHYLALGQRPSWVVLFDTGTYQEFRRLDHGEEIEHIAIKGDDRLVASSGLNMTKVWDLNHDDCLYEFQHEGVRALGLEFDGDLLLAPRGNDVTFAWDLVSCESKESANDCPSVVGDHKFWNAAICLSVRLVAVPGEKHDVMILDLDSGDHIRSCGEPPTESPILYDIEFNNQNGQLAIGRSRELVVVDPLIDEVLSRREARCDALASSSDGRILAALDSLHSPAIIKLFDFETLALLYTINTTAGDVELLCFTRDDMHLAGIYGRYATHCMVWGLEQANAASGSDLKDLQATEQDGRQDFEAPEYFAIEALLVPAGEQVIICGRADGAVRVYDAKTGAFSQTVFKSSSGIQILHWWPKRRAVLCVAKDNTITLQPLPPQASSGANAPAYLLSFKVDTDSWIHDVMIDNDAGRMIISTCSGPSYLYNDRGDLLGTASFCEEAQDRRFATLPGLPGKAYCFSEMRGVQVYDTNSWTGRPQNTDITGFVDWPLRGGVHADFFFQHQLFLSPDRSIVVVKGGGKKVSKGPSTFIVRLDLSSLRREGELDDASDVPLGGHWPATPPTPPTPGTPQTPQTPQVHSVLYNVPLRQILHVSNEGRVLFIDDAMWLSSLNLNTASPLPSVPGSDGSAPTATNAYSRHFFIPAEAFKGEDVEIACATFERDLVLALHGQPILVKGFLEREYEVCYDSYVSYQTLRGDVWDYLSHSIDPNGRSGP